MIINCLLSLKKQKIKELLMVKLQDSQAIKSNLKINQVHQKMSKREEEKLIYKIMKLLAKINLNYKMIWFNMISIYKTLKNRTKF